MHHESCEFSRRDFLRTGATLTAAAGLASVPAFAAGPDEGAKPPLPTRKLGKSGLDVCILNQGTAMKLNNRMLNIIWEEGIRYFDLADCYEGGKSEQTVGQWLKDTGRRKEVFLVTKDHADTPDEWVAKLDRRLEAIQTDYVDLYFIHGLGWPGRDGDEAAGKPKDKEWAKAADRIRKSGKAKIVGFSTHARQDLRTQLLNEAAVGGWVDAIMVATSPSLMRKDADFNKALDACHQAGIGLISMKEMRGVSDIPEVVPDFEKLGLTKYAAVLSAIWTDERFQSICSAMQNVKIVRENAGYARDFKPLSKDQLGMVNDTIDTYVRSYCPGCDGSCSIAANTQAPLGEIARYLSYFEHDGDIENARRLFRELPPAQRDWTNADLAAATRACKSKLPFDELLARVQQKLA